MCAMGESSANMEYPKMYKAGKCGQNKNSQVCKGYEMCGGGKYNYNKYCGGSSCKNCGGYAYNTYWKCMQNSGVSKTEWSSYAMQHGGCGSGNGKGGK